MSVVSKAEQFDEYLKTKEIPWFEKLEQNDDLKTVVYRGNLDAAGQRFPLMVIVDDSVFTMVRKVVLAGAIKEEYKTAFAKYLLKLNGDFKIFKYYQDEKDGHLYLDISVPSGPQHFDAELILYLIVEILLPHLEEFYPQIMEVAWGKTSPKQS